MPHYKIMNDELSVWFDPTVQHFSLIISNSNKRIQTVVLMTPEEVDNLLEAIGNYRSMKAKSDKQMGLFYE